MWQHFLFTADFFLTACTWIWTSRETLAERSCETKTVKGRGLFQNATEVTSSLETVKLPPCVSQQFLQALKSDSREDSPLHLHISVLWRVIGSVCKNRTLLLPALKAKMPRTACWGLLFFSKTLPTVGKQFSFSLIVTDEFSKSFQTGGRRPGFADCKVLCPQEQGWGKCFWVLFMIVKGYFFSFLL